MRTVHESSPRVSVVVPTHNRAEFLPRAIGSILAQTFSNFELLVVDDGSTDRTADVVRGFNDPRIRLLHLGGRCGAGRARNVGIEASRGEWVAFLDSDDEWLPLKLELQMARVGQSDVPNAEVVYCERYQDYGPAKRISPSLPSLPEGDILDDFFKSPIPTTTSVFMVRRSSLLEIGGFDESLPSYQDLDLWLRLAGASNRFVTVNRALVIKHNHTGTRISNDPIAPLRGLRLFDRRWGAIVRRRIGVETYRRWKARHLAIIRDALSARLRAAKAAGESSRTCYCDAGSGHSNAGDAPEPDYTAPSAWSGSNARSRTVHRLWRSE